jgi:DNA-directed RNA polymerase subunit N (RpoN/RPB10)
MSVEAFMAARGFINAATAKERYERQKQRVKEHHRKYRAEVLEALGGKCACCGEAEPAFMAIDHANSDGAKQRQEDPGQLNLTCWIRKRMRHKQPLDGFRLLCYNCNFATRFGDPCPHTLRSPIQSIGSTEQLLEEVSGVSP